MLIKLLYDVFIDYAMKFVNIKDSLKVSSNCKMPILWGSNFSKEAILNIKANFKKTSVTLKYRMYGYLTTRCSRFTDDPI